jgi:putative FmdB family regulatory protein
MVLFWTFHPRWDTIQRVVLASSDRPSGRDKTMPDYEFRCEACKKEFTLRQTFQEHDRTQRVKCPHCGSPKVTRTIGAVFAKTSKKS